MKQRPEALLSKQPSTVYLLYGNNAAIEDFFVTEFFPRQSAAEKEEVKSFTETGLLAVSKETLYLENSLFNPIKLYIVHDVTDKFFPLLQSYTLQIPLVMVGKNLKSSSKIVTYMANHSIYQSVAIYGDEATFLEAFIKHQLKDYKPTAEIIGMLLSHISTFSVLTKQLKLLLQMYVPEEILTIDKVEKALIPQNEANIFKVAETIISKNPKAMIDIFQKSQHVFEKEMIVLLRIIAKQFLDLLNLRRNMDSGASAQQVVNQATPMIPFNRRPQIIHNLSKWSVKGILSAIVKLDEMEILNKQNDLWSPDLMERCFLQMCKL
jgi:DNA polymerase III delta subunit